MAQYRAVEYTNDLVALKSQEVAGFDPDIPRSKPQYTFRAAEYKPLSDYPRIWEAIVEEYVWVGPGGDTDSEHAYWG